MNTSIATVRIVGITPLSQSHQHDEPKLEGERPDDYDKRTWRSKLNTAERDGKQTVVIPAHGLHQAIEAKEGVQVRPELQTLATISVQSFVRRYPVVCGMTGTAMTDAKELEATYGTTVVEIPTPRPVQRLDEEDLIFRTHAEALAYAIEQSEADR